MKGIRAGLLLVVLASFTFGCSMAPEKLPGRSAEPQGGHVAVASVADSSTQTGPPSGLVWCGFAVRDFRVVRDEYGRVHVIGEVENVGTGTRGVELQASLRDAH